ncbi:ATP-binding protein [Candidatus Symbiopectobacterium sp. NZEC127]|uniref:ATP-binding protein n=1 Tax=Candidatus Symbiopectobacterium sp. NZEC127 TaxID=2820472 RepID=UPI002226ED01|nr:ATP-binding protein [Candidatus Symbiopectobacterium sp. NZEC127]MCW2485743.1 ATP-binding protein [Candidatus Symbiopectobacterium sp. NZEC127]
MLDSNQRKEREDLKSQWEALNDELAFAEEHKKPWQWGHWESGGIRTVQCPTHGEHEQLTLIGKSLRGGEHQKHSRCPRCVRDELAQVEAKQRSLRVSELLENAGIALRFEPCEFENFQTINPIAAKNLSACQRYAESWPQRLDAGTGIVMTGSCGTGKNHLAVSMTKKIIRDHLASVELTDVMRITRAVKSTWRNSSELTEGDVLRHYSSLDLLIIDEVGVQFGTQAESVILQEIINARYENILPTILISNLTFEQLQGAIGERIVDRVAEGGRNRLAFNWPSYRGNAA